MGKRSAPFRHPPVRSPSPRRVGAIGTGILLLLEAVGESCRILLIDRQRFAKENLGTYSIGTKADIASAPWKVDWQRRIFIASTWSRNTYP
jgi:hypothetical protein